MSESSEIGGEESRYFAVPTRSHTHTYQAPVTHRIMQSTVVVLLACLNSYLPTDHQALYEAIQHFHSHTYAPIFLIAHIFVSANDKAIYFYDLVKNIGRASLVCHPSISENPFLGMSTEV